MSRNELDAFVPELPQILEAVPAYPAVAIRDSAIDDDSIDDEDVVPSRPDRPASRPLRRLASAVWRGTCAVAYAPVAFVVFLATRIWRFGSWVVSGIWRGVTGVVTFVMSIVRACTHATARVIVATARLCVAIVRAIVYAPVALVRFVVSIVAACVHAAVRTVVAIGGFCLSVVHAVGAGIRTAVTACVTALQRFALGTWDAVTGVVVFVGSIVHACVYGVVRAVVATGGFCLSVVHAVGAGIRTAVTACVTAVQRLALATWDAVTGGLAFLKSIVHACVYGVERAVVAIRTGCVFVADSIAAAVRAIVTACATAVRSVTQATWRGVTRTVVFVKSIADACVHGVERAIVATRTACVRGASAVARVVVAIQASSVFVAHAVGVGVLAFVTSIIRACVYGVVWTAVVSRALCVLGAKAIRAGVNATRSSARAIVAGVALSIRHVVTSVLASAAAGARAGEAGAERALLAGGRSYARSANAIVSGVSAVRSGSQAVAATAAREAQTLSVVGRRVGRRAQAAGQTWFTSLSDTAQALPARVAAFKVTVRVGVPSTGDASGHAWSRVAEAAPTIGAIALAGLGTASTVLVMWTLPGAPARQARVNASEALSPVQAAIVAPVVSQPSAPPAVARPAVAQVNVRDEAQAVSNVSTPALNASKMRAIWLKTDTRSLDRALSTVRQTTLAFRTCSVQVTATDQAVARCDLAPTGGDGRTSSGRTAWTIGFTRADDQWRIDDITETSSGRSRR